jgi:hypothetical protein
MDWRDWELLDKQLRGPNPSRRNGGLTVLMAVVVFFTGMTVGGILFAPETQPMRIASNHTTAAMKCDYNGVCRIWSHPHSGNLVAL